VAELADLGRLILWVPVAFGVGVGIYFGLEQEPDHWFAPIVASAALGLALLLRRRQSLFVVCMGLLLLAGGFSAAQWRSHAVAAPLLTGRIGPVEIIGTVEAVEPRGGARRLVIAPSEIEGLATADLPRRVRVRSGSEAVEDLLPGDPISLRAVLLPPPPPVAPGAYDFGREAYFRGIGAVGFAISRPVALREGSGSLGPWQTFWEGIRLQLGREVADTLPTDQAGVARALLTGERGALPEPLIEAYRASGLAHLLAISGLHVGLITGLFFLLLRGGLALWPRAALDWPTKKIAAAVTLTVLPFYPALVGASIPTQRACLMAGVVLLAVLLDRRAISLRLVATAALAILLVRPESLISASFQLSFAAVTGLVAAYEWWTERRRFHPLPPPSGLLGKVPIYLGGVMVSSMIATVATAPFAVFHFDRLALYGLLANMIAVPVTGLWIMPLVLATYFLDLFGLAALALVPLGWGVAVINATAEWVARLPGAVQLLPAMPLWGLTLIVFGGLALCLWRGLLRLLGLPLLLAGSFSGLAADPPDILINDDGRLIAVAGPSGDLHLSNDRLDRFAASIWLERNGQSEAGAFPPVGAPAAPWLRCDALACRYRARGFDVALVFLADALAEDCARSDLIVATVPVSRRCKRETPTVDFFSLWRAGAHAVWLTPENRRPRIQSVRDARGARPWSPERVSGKRVHRPFAEAGIEDQ